MLLSHVGKNVARFGALLLVLTLVHCKKAGLGGGSGGAPKCPSDKGAAAAPNGPGQGLPQGQGKDTHDQAANNNNQNALPNANDGSLNNNGGQDPLLGDGKNDQGIPGDGKDDGKDEKDKVGGDFAACSPDAGALLFQTPLEALLNPSAAPVEGENGAPVDKCSLLCPAERKSQVNGIACFFSRSTKPGALDTAEKLAAAFPALIDGCRAKPPFSEANPITTCKALPSACTGWSDLDGRNLLFYALNFGHGDFASQLVEQKCFTSLASKDDPRLQGVKHDAFGRTLHVLAKEARLAAVPCDELNDRAVAISKFFKKLQGLTADPAVVAYVTALKTDADKIPAGDRSLVGHLQDIHASLTKRACFAEQPGGNAAKDALKAILTALGAPEKEGELDLKKAGPQESKILAAALNGIPPPLDPQRELVGTETEFLEKLLPPDTKILRAEIRQKLGGQRELVAIVQATGATGPSLLVGHGEKFQSFPFPPGAHVPPAVRTFEAGDLRLLLVDGTPPLLVQRNGKTGEVKQEAAAPVSAAGAKTFAITFDGKACSFVVPDAAAGNVTKKCPEDPAPVAVTAVVAVKRDADLLGALTKPESSKLEFPKLDLRTFTDPVTKKLEPGTPGTLNTLFTLNTGLDLPGTTKPLFDTGFARGGKNPIVFGRMLAGPNRKTTILFDGRALVLPDSATPPKFYGGPGATQGVLLVSSTPPQPAQVVVFRGLNQEGKGRSRFDAVPVPAGVPPDKEFTVKVDPPRGERYGRIVKFGAATPDGTRTVTIISDPPPEEGGPTALAEEKTAP